MKKFKKPTKKEKLQANQWLDSLPNQHKNFIRILYHNNNPIIPPDKVNTYLPLEPKHLQNFLDDQQSCPLCHSKSLEIKEINHSPHKHSSSKSFLCHHCGLNFKITLSSPIVFS